MMVLWNLELILVKKKSFTISHKTLYTKNFLLITSEFVFYFLKITFWMLEYMQKTNGTYLIWYRRKTPYINCPTIATCVSCFNSSRKASGLLAEDESNGLDMWLLIPLPLSTRKQMVQRELSAGIFMNGRKYTAFEHSWPKIIQILIMIMRINLMW